MKIDIINDFIQIDLPLCVSKFNIKFILNAKYLIIKQLENCDTCIMNFYEK